MRNGSSQSIALLPELRAFRLVLIITMHSRYYILHSNYALVTANCMNRASDHRSVYRTNERSIFFFDNGAGYFVASLINNLSPRRGTSNPTCPFIVFHVLNSDALCTFSHLLDGKRPAALRGMPEPKRPPSSLSARVTRSTRRAYPLSENMFAVGY